MRGGNSLRQDEINFTFFTNTLNFSAEKIIWRRLIGCPVEGYAGWNEMFKFISGAVFYWSGPPGKRSGGLTLASYHLLLTLDGDDLP
jgi:hypothetical protein